MMKSVACAFAVLSATLAVVSCSDEARVVASPDLECDGALSGTFEVDVTAPSFDDPDDAAIDMLQPSERRYGGEIVPVRSGVQALVVDGRRVLVAHSGESFDGGERSYVFSSLHWCEGFFEDDGFAAEPPRAEPPAAPTED